MTFASRFLKINDVKVDIDEKTAIGIDLQSYNIKKPGQKHINVSNSFTTPPTANNKAIYGNINDPQSENKSAYGINICNYWVENEQLISNAKIRLQKCGDRIENFIYEKADFWDQTKKDDWPTFAAELLDWLATEKGLPSITSPYTGVPNDLITNYQNTTEGLFFPFFYGALAAYNSIGSKLIHANVITRTPAVFPSSIVYDVTSFIAPISNILTVSSSSTEDELAVIMADDMNIQWGNENFVARAIGNTIEVNSIIGVSDSQFNFLVGGTIIVDRPISQVIQVGISASTTPLEELFEPPLPNGIEASIYLKKKTAEENVLGGHYCVYVRTIFEFIESKYGVNFLTSGGVLPGNIWDDIIAQKLYIPIRDYDIHLESGNSYFFFRTDADFGISKKLKDKPAKNVYSFINSFMQIQNVIKDELYVGGENVIRLARFDDLENIAEVKEFSGRISGQPEIVPFIKDYGQLNKIKFKEIYPDGDELINSKALTCLNLNLDAEKDLLEIDAYIPSVLSVNSQSFSYLADKESFKTFTFYISNSQTAGNVVVFYSDSVAVANYATNTQMQISSIYDLGSEYNFLDKIIKYPKYYEIKKWLTISDIRNFEFFKQYYIRELNGSFFINKIKGFNPLSKQPTTLELIKISNKTPVTPPDADPWVDGVGSIWEDGEGAFWF